MFCFPKIHFNIIGHRAANLDMGCADKIKVSVCDFSPAFRFRIYEYKRRHFKYSTASMETKNFIDILCYRKLKKCFRYVLLSLNAQAAKAQNYFQQKLVTNLGSEVLTAVLPKIQVL
jgi:hemerythrin